MGEAKERRRAAAGSAVRDPRAQRCTPPPRRSPPPALTAAARLDLPPRPAAEISRELAPASREKSGPPRRNDGTRRAAHVRTVMLRPGRGAAVWWRAGLCRACWQSCGNGKRKLTVVAI